MSTKPKDLSKVPPQLRAHVGRNVRSRAALTDNIKTILKASDQPLSAAEVRFRLAKGFKHDVHLPRVAGMLDQLVTDGHAASRTESATERAIRASGGRLGGPRATLYFPGKTVPARTKRLHDIVVGDGKAVSDAEAAYKERYLKGGKRRRKQARAGSGKAKQADGRHAGPGKATPQTGNLVEAVRELVEARDRFARRVEQLEETLARIDKMLAR